MGWSNGAELIEGRDDYIIVWKEMRDLEEICGVTRDLERNIVV
jgi:hypothetical protein